MVGADVDGADVYMRFGDWFPWACGLAVAGALAVADRRPAPAVEASRLPPRGSGRRPRPVAGGAGPPRTLVVLPTYNERDDRPRSWRACSAVAPAPTSWWWTTTRPTAPPGWCASSPSGTPAIRLHSRPGQAGAGQRIPAGFRRALEEGYDVVVEMDSDLSHRPEDLPRILRGARSTT